MLINKVIKLAEELTIESSEAGDIPIIRYTFANLLSLSAQEPVIAFTSVCLTLYDSTTPINQELFNGIKSIGEYYIGMGIKDPDLEPQLWEDLEDLVVRAK